MNRNGTKEKHFIMRLVAGLPLGVLYVVSDIGYYLVYYIIRYRRRLVRRNLVNSFPGRKMDFIIETEKKFYRSFCDVFIESFKTLNISDEEMRERVDVRNTELVERLAGEGKNVFMLLGHCGCWEWFQEVSVRYRLPKRGCELYKEIESPYFASLMAQVRSRWDTEQVEMRQAVRKMLQWSSEGELFLAGFICDQRPGGMKCKDVMGFMCQPTGFVPGAEEIARKVKAELVYLDVERTSRGHYRLTFRELTVRDEYREKKYPKTCEFFRALQDTIIRQPELWLWSHNRWASWE